MNKTEQFYLALIQRRLPDAFDLDEIDWNVFYDMTLKQFMSSVIYDTLGKNKVSFSGKEELKKQAMWMYSRYYQIEQFTSKVVSLFETNGIDYILLKGLTLAKYYPQCEWRKLGDIDIYIEDKKDIEKAKGILIENGFLLHEDVSDHQLRFYYKSFLLELHFHIIGLYQNDKVNQVVSEVFKAPIDCVEVELHGKTYRTLPPTKYVYYMLHHMAKHYMHSGFGVRLLMDYTYYINANQKDIDFTQVEKWCQQSGMLNFYQIILGTCSKYLGLNIEVNGVSEKTCENFMEKVLHDKDVGEGSDKVVGRSRSYEKVNLWTYITEGHFQMKRRFPKLSKCFILWPILWVITLVLFLKNTYFLRKQHLKKP